MEAPSKPRTTLNYSPPVRAEPVGRPAYRVGRPGRDVRRPLRDERQRPERARRAHRVTAWRLAQHARGPRAHPGPVTGEINGQQVQRSRELALTLTLDEEGTYRVLGDEETTRPTNTTRQVVVENEYGPLRRAGVPALLVLSLLGLLGLVGTRYTGRLDVTAAERDRLAFERARGEFDEWSTAVGVDRPADPVTVHTLDGLVDLAIDTGERVLEAPEYERYYVFDDRTHDYVAPAPVGRTPETTLAVVPTEEGEFETELDAGARPD